MTMRAVRRVLPALLVAAAACAVLSDVFREPDIQLQRATLRSVGLTGGNLELAVQVYNPNRFDLRGTDLQVGFAVEGSHVGDVRYEDEYTVQQGDTTVVVLPLRFEWAGVGSALRTALTTGDLPYTMNGQARLDTPLGPRSVNFTRSGRVPLTRAAGVIVPSGS